MLTLIHRIKSLFVQDDVKSDLLTIIEGFNPKNSFEERVDYLKRLMAWLRRPMKRNNQFISDPILSRTIHYKYLIQFLERSGTHRGNFFSFVNELIQKGQTVRLYCLTGIPESHGFLNELSERIVIKFIPPTLREMDLDLAEIFRIVFTEDEDAIWFETASEEIII